MAVCISWYWLCTWCPSWHSIALLRKRKTWKRIPWPILSTHGQWPVAWEEDMEDMEDMEDTGMLKKILPNPGHWEEENVRGGSTGTLKKILQDPGDWEEDGSLTGMLKKILQDPGDWEEGGSRTGMLKKILQESGAEEEETGGEEEETAGETEEEDIGKEEGGGRVQES